MCRIRLFQFSLFGRRGMASAVLLLATLFATWPNQVATESDNEPFGSQSGNRCVDDENRSQVRIFFLMIPKFRPLGIS